MYNKIMIVDRKLDDQFYLKVLQLEDAEEYFELVDNYREVFREWLSWVDETNEVGDVLSYIEGCQFDLEEEAGLVCGIWLEGRLVGCVGLVSIDWQHRRAEIGFWLSPKLQGKGYMKQAVEELIVHADEVLQLHRLEIVTAVANQASCRLAEACGFADEGTMHEAIFMRGKYWDARMYGKVVRSMS